MGKQGTVLFIIAFISLLTGCGKDAAVPADAAVIKLLDNSGTLQPAIRNSLLDSIDKTLQYRDNDSLNRLLHQKVAWNYYDNGNFKRCMTVSQRLYKMAAQKNDSVRMAHSMFYMGDYLDLNAQRDSALYYYHEAGKIYLALNDTIDAARAQQNNIGILYHCGSYAQAETEAIKALKLYKKINDSELIFDGYLTLALTLTDMKNYDKAGEYFDLALKQADKLEKEGFDKKYLLHFRLSCYNDKGILYQAKTDYRTAIALYDKGLDMPGVRAVYPNLYAMLLNNRAYSRMKLGDTGNRVAADFWESQRIRDSIGFKPGIITGKVRLGEFLLAKHDTVRALSYIKEAYRDARLTKSSSDITDALTLLALADRKNTSYYSSLYFKVNDSLQQAERAVRDKFARIAYETNTVQDQNNVLSTQSVYITIAGGVLLLFTAALLLILRLKARNSELLFQQRQQQANEKIYTVLMQQETEAEKAKMEERNRIATTLKEGIMNRILILSTQLATITTRESDKKQLLVQELEETRDGINKLSQDLKESFLSENESFAEALKNLLAKQQEASGIAFHIHIDTFINRNTVSIEQRVAIFRIVQEACTNAKKYSGAANCNISLEAAGNTLKLRIRDDGRGFDPKKAKDGIGLRNIRERVEALGGTFNNFSAPGSGTLLDIIV